MMGITPSQLATWKMVNFRIGPATTQQDLLNNQLHCLVSKTAQGFEIMVSYSARTLIQVMQIKPGRHFISLVYVR